MTAEAERGRQRRNRLILLLAVIAVLLAALIVPPLVSISRYKSRITQLVSSSLGRPVRLSSVELRLIPRPGFVITDLTVEEDPAYGAEPVLHANTVVASIRLLSLWRGRLELSRISVDEASLNLVHDDAGQWNFDPLFRAATNHGGPQTNAQPFPYLEATNSRVNLKKGIEKLPYSLVNADVSFWQESDGEWRIRLRGQPARTDVSLDLADTGIVRLEARLRSAQDRNHMPIHLDLDWREAQLGQLSRLILGSDPGWRGDLTGEVQLDGTAETAQVKTRLTATNVHRAEFAPQEALDFDANCSLEYHYLGRSAEKLFCDSPLGDGHVMLTGDRPGDDRAKYSVEVQRIPVSAGIDVLRTLRSGFNSDLEARGTVSGKIAYDPSVFDTKPEQANVGRAAKRRRTSAVASEPASPLSGSLTVDDLRLSSGGLAQPIQLAKLTIEPAGRIAGSGSALAANISIPAGVSTPLTVAVQLSSKGYEAAIHGPASLPRIRELAKAAGMGDIPALAGLAGDPAALDLTAEGPWLPATNVELTRVTGPSGLDDALALENANSDRLAGTITLHNANWRSDALANRVEIAQAVLHLGGDAIVWDPIEFTDGPVKGTASFQPAPRACATGQECLPQLDLRFGDLDAAEVQATLLGAHQQSTVFSSLIERFSASSAPEWPHMNGTLKADSLKLGPIEMKNASVAFQIRADGAEVESFTGNLLGGQLRGTGSLKKGDKPDYTFEGSLDRASAASVCQLFSLRGSGGAINGSGKVELVGFTDKDLAASAKGALHFEWQRGVVDEGSESTEIPKALSRFDRWIADATIANNEAAITSSEVHQGVRRSSIDATVSFGDPPSVAFSEAKPAQSATR